MVYFIGFLLIFGVINFIVTIYNMRVFGMGWGCMLLFVWMILIYVYLIILVLTLLVVTVMMLLLDCNFGILFFNLKDGGFAFLW